MKTFFDLDYSWSLCEQFIFSIFERNLAEFVADLPVLYHLLRRISERLEGLKASLKGRNNEAKNRSDSSKENEFSLVTIGAAVTHPPRIAALGGFRAYGRNAQISGFEAEAFEDELPLREDSPHAPEENGAIVVKTDVDVWSENENAQAREERNKSIIWPLE